MSFADDLLLAEGDVVVIPLALAKKIGLPAAAFLKQAAYLSAVVKQNGGWFFLRQEGEGDPQAEKIFTRLGSWQAILGIGPDAQDSIRKQLKKLGLLEETRKGMTHGYLQYRVLPQKYLEFLASCSGTPTPSSTHCFEGQTGNPDCTIRKTDLNNRKNPDDNNKDEAPGGKIPPPPLPPKPAKTNPTPDGVDSGGDLNTTPTPNEVFFEAAGKPEVLASELAKIQAALSGATHDQARLAGLAWLSTKEKDSPVGLAVSLCRTAALGGVTPCKAAKEEAVSAEKAKVAAGYARLRALAGQKFVTQRGKTARISTDGEWIDLDDGGQIFGQEVLTCLQHIEEGRWQPIAC